MNDEDTKMAYALSLGMKAAIVFFIANVAFVFYLHDAQGTIGLCISPFLAAWIGVSVALIVMGWQILASSNEKARKWAVLTAVFYLLHGIVGIVVITAWYGSEVYQAMHPTIVGHNVSSAKSVTI